MLLSELAAKYRLRNLRSATKSSLRLWEIALRLFDRYLERPATADDLTDDTFAGFIVWRRRTAAAATVNRDLVSLLALWRWCHRMGHVDRWPDVALEKVPERTPLAWTRDEFGALMRAARAATGNIGCIPAARWWPALLLVLFDTGERIAAVMALQWQHVDLDQCWILFPAETRKGQQRDSLVKISDDTADALRRIRGRGDVFPWPYCTAYIWRRYGDLLKQAGLPNDRARKFHAIRKTTASHLEAAGGNATEALRHQHRKTTQAYLDPRIVKPSQAVDLLWRPE